MNATLDRETAENRAEAEAHMEDFANIGRTMNRTQNLTNPGPVLDELDDMIQAVSDGVLDISVTRTVHIVLGTGGPHTEIRWPENGRPSVVCFGWFGAGRYERELTAEEVTGLESSIGDWEDLAQDR